MRLAYNAKLKEVNAMEKKYEFNHQVSRKLYEITDSIEGSIGSEEADLNEI